MATPDASTAARSARPGANVAAALEHTAAVRASAEAVIDGDVRFDYATLGRRIAGVGAGLLSLGLAPGDVVATLALNSYRHLECWLAIPRVGLVLNELNTRLAAAELAFILDDSEARICWIAGPVDQEPWATRVRSAGVPFVGVEVSIRRPDGTVADTDEVGEVWLRGPNIMAGYWRRPQETAAALTPDGWYRSGDAARSDADGYAPRSRMRSAHTPPCSRQQCSGFPTSAGSSGSTPQWCSARTAPRAKTSSPTTVGP